MQRRRAGSFVFTHSAIDVHRIAVAGVRVAHQRDVHRIGDVPHVLDHLGHSEQSNVRKPARRRGPKAGHVHGLKARRLGDTGLKGIEGKGGHHHFRAVEHLT